MKKQSGQVLVIGLIILLILTFAAMTLLDGSVEDERGATNMRGQSDAFMAAEAGMSAARDSSFITGANWYDFNDPDIGSCAEGFELARDDGFNGHSAYVVTVDAGGCGASVLHLTSVGTVNNANAMRQLEFSLRYTGARPAPINFIGDIATYEGGNSNVFEVDGAGGIAVSTNSDANRQTVYDNIEEEGRLDNYKGGIDNINFEPPWDSTANIQSFIEALIGETPDHIGSDVPTDLGSSPDNYRTTVITGNANIDMNGNKSGAGILVVTGDLNFSGTPSWDGIIIALGGVVNIDGGGTGYIKGTMFIADVEVPDEWYDETTNTIGEDVNWADGSGSVYIQKGGGTANYIYDCGNVTKAYNMMPEAAQDQWTINNADACGGTGTPLGRVYIDSWQEVVNQ